jgi:23S rRNA pseudouridine2605 synthase
MNDKPEDERPKGRGRRDAPRGAGPRARQGADKPVRRSSPKGERDDAARADRPRTGRFKEKPAGRSPGEAGERPRAGRSFSKGAAPQARVSGGRGAEERPRRPAKSRFESKPRYDENPRFEGRPAREAAPPSGGRARSGPRAAPDKRAGTGRDGERASAPRGEARPPKAPAGADKRFGTGERRGGTSRFAKNDHFAKNDSFAKNDRVAKNDRFDKGERPRTRAAGAPSGAAVRTRKPPQPLPAAPAVDEGHDDGRDRIAKAMARAGVASRRDAEVMIAEGRVSLNGEPVSTPATLVGPADRIALDGVEISARERTRLWLFHKPRGLVTTARDPEGRATVFDALPAELPRVVTIGRLDINTEGLILLTNDGGLARVLAHPATGWLRRYRVRAYGEIDQATLDGLADGITVDEMHYGPIEAKLERVQGDNVWLTLGLREGKNREVKRVLEHLGLRVNRLIRVSFGPFQLGDLAEGAVEEVRTAVLRDQLGDRLAAEAGVDLEGPAPAVEVSRATPRSAEAFEERAGGKGRGRDDHGRPARSVWRDSETEERRPPSTSTRVPRRGADPKTAREENAAREHRRASPVTDPKGRRVRVERIVSAPAEAKPARSGPRRPPRDMAEAPERREGRGFQGARPRGGADTAGRPGGAKPRGLRPAGEGRPAGERFRPKSPGGKGPGGKDRGGQGLGGKRPGGRDSGKDRGDRPGGPRRPRS